MNSSERFSVLGRKVLLTGGTRGLGRSIAEGFLQAGAEVVITGTSEKVFDAAEKLAEATGGKAHGVIVDLEDAGQIPGAYQKALDALGGRLDVLVNCAGIQHRCPAAEFPLEMWDRIIRVNLSAVFQLSQLAVKTMLPYGGKIINIASMTSFFGSEGIPAYTASKGGVMQLTKALSNEWSGQGIQVNAIAPGFFVTEQNHALLMNPDGSLTARSEKILNHTPQGRFGDPYDLLGALLWLCDHEASGFVDGVVVPVDGGFAAYSGV